MTVMSEAVVWEKEFPAMNVVQYDTRAQARQVAELFNQLEHYRTLADLRGKLVGYLMAHNNPMASVQINAIERLEREKDFEEGPRPANEERLREALKELNLAVQDVIGN